MGGHLLGQAVGEFRLALAGSQPDGDGQSQVLPRPSAQLARPALQVSMGRTADPAEGLVDRIDLQLFAVGLQQAHHPLAHVGVEGVIGAAHHHVLLLQLLSRLEVRRSHGDAESPRFGTAGHDATVVVGQHHHRAPDQGWIEALFAGGVEVVAVDQGDGLGHGGRLRAGGSHGSPPPRSARRRSGAVRGRGNPGWRPPGAAAPGDASGV